MSADVSIRSTRDPRLLSAAHDAFRHLDDSLTPEERARRETFPPLLLIEALDSYPEKARLAFVSPAVRTIVDQAQTLGGDAWLDTYFRLVLLQLVVRTLVRPPAYRLPASVDELLAADFLRIIANAWSPTSRYTFDGDLVFDLGLCNGRMLPFGVQFVQIPFQIRPQVFERASLPHLPPRPWLHTHLRKSVRADLNRQTRSDLNARLGEFMVENPEYEGVFGVTWWNDPVVAQISPHLAYIAEQNEEIGAHVFPMDTTDEATIKYATSTSKTRRRLYEEGRYTPTDYGILYLRDNLIRWAKSHPIQNG